MSLQARLMSAALLVLVVFTLLTGLALDKAFRQSAEAAMQDRMEGYLFALLAAVDVNDRGQLVFGRRLPDVRFEQPDSGLYAQVRRADGRSTLISASLLDHAPITGDHLKPGQQRFSRRQFNGRPHFLLAYGASWEQADGTEIPLYYSVAEDMAAFLQQIDRYRQTLWSWLASAVLLLLLVQWQVLRWGLRPLRQVSSDLAQIEAGQVARLQGRYPAEIQQLADKINNLLDSTRSQLQRYRDSLGNMAHSLKTPLAILTNILESDRQNGPSDAEAQQQLQRIRQIIDYQLQHAATAGQAASSGPLALEPLIRRLIEAMQKVHRHKPVTVTTRLAVSSCRCDEGDAMEMLGNLIENAFKWCNSRIEITTRPAVGNSLRLCVEDDGPGIAEAQRQRVLVRGQRADTAVSGNGIGLAMVQEIVLLYGGRLEIGQGRLTGAAICITLPAGK